MQINHQFLAKYRPKRHTERFNDGEVPVVHTIFRAPAIEIQFASDGSRGVVATQPIRSGELILIEHCQANVWTVLQSTIRSHRAWFNELFPRNECWSADRLMAGTLDSESSAKVEANGFRTSTKGTFVMGRTVCAFNHSDRPNVGMIQTNLCDTGIEAPSAIISVVALGGIAAGDAVTIQYTNEPTPVHPYVTSTPRVVCPASAVATRIIDQYVAKSPAYQRVLRHQECANHGLYNVDLDRVTLDKHDSLPAMLMTPRYREYVQQFNPSDSSALHEAFGSHPDLIRTIPLIWAHWEQMDRSIGS